VSKVYEISKGRRRYQAASEWIVKLDRGLTPEEDALIKVWLADDPENHQKLLVVAKHWDQLGVLAKLADLVPHKPEQRSRQVPVILAFAAALAFAAVGAVVMSFPTSRDTSAASSAFTYETQVGEQSTVTLADGSVIVLNTNSSVAIDFSLHQRVLHLERGEVHVVVAHDPSRPFSVYVRNRIVQAVGTAFAVEIIDDNQIDLVVTEGRVLVAITPPKAVRSPISAPVLPISSLKVAQGESVRLGGRTSSPIEPVSSEEISVRLSWREGNLIFRGESLGAAMAEVGRYTPVEFVFLDNQLKQERIVGRFKAGDVEGLLAVLRTNLGIAYQYTDDGRILLSSM